MINNIVLVGRTTKTIELKQNKNGTNYVQFTLAVNRPYKDEQGGNRLILLLVSHGIKRRKLFLIMFLKG